MPDQVEFILKKIHVLFAKCEPYQASPDHVVICKREFFQILEELNVAIYDVLDRYEATARSKEKARLEVERNASEIMADARRTAEDMNAASLLYTDSMLDEVKSIVNRTNDELKRVFENLAEEMKDRAEFLDQNKEEVKQQLIELHEGQRYLTLLNEQRKLEKDAAAKAPEINDKEESDGGKPRKAEIVVRVHNQKEEVRPKFSKEEKKKKLEELLAAEGHIEELQPIEDPQLEKMVFQAENFDLDAEYDTWKEGQGQAFEGKAAKKEKRSIFGKKK